MFHAFYDTQLVLGGMHQSTKFCFDDFILAADLCRGLHAWWCTWLLGTGRASRARAARQVGWLSARRLGSAGAGCRSLPALPGPPSGLCSLVLGGGVRPLVLGLLPALSGRLAGCAALPLPGLGLPPLEVPCRSGALPAPEFESRPPFLLGLSARGPVPLGGFLHPSLCRGLLSLARVPREDPCRSGAFGALRRPPPACTRVCVAASSARALARLRARASGMLFPSRARVPARGPVPLGGCLGASRLLPPACARV